MLLHLELRTRQIREDGTNAADAERIAQRDFGNLSLLRETSREVWTWRWMESISQDLCFGVRQLAKQPGFALIAILTLALGIGANCAIFSLLNAVIIRQVPVRQPKELVWFGSGRATGSTVDLPDRGVTLFSYPFFREFRRATKAFSDVAAVFSLPLKPMAESTALRVWRGSRSSWSPERISPLSVWARFRDVCSLKLTTALPADTH